MRPNPNCCGQGNMHRPDMMPGSGRPPMPGGYPNGGPMPMPMRPPVNGNCPGGCGGPGPVRPPRMPELQTESGCAAFDQEHFPVGMGYVPMQGWESTYPMEQGFQRGTIFPSLDDPFMMGRCRS